MTTAGISGQVSAFGERTGDSLDATLSTGEASVRGVYTMPMWYWDGPSVERNRAKMHEFLNRAETAGLNVLHAWIESDGLASLLGEPAYAESDTYDFWNPNRGWDPLGELVTAAAQRGIEVHLWYSFVRYKRSSLPVPEFNPDLEVLPPGDPGWAALSKSEYEQGYRSSADVHANALCANEPGARAWAIEALDRAFARYPLLSGLHIEEPGYLDAERCVCPRCRNLYADLHDDDPANYVDHVYNSREHYTTDGLAIPVKTHGTDAFAEALYDWWQSTDSCGVLSYNGSWLPAYDIPRGRNWPEWSEQGWMPYYSPQIYTRNVDSYRYRLRTTMEAVSDTVVAPVTGLKWGTDEHTRNDTVTVIDQIETVEEMDGHDGVETGGTSLFAGVALAPDTTLGLRAGPYRQSASPHWAPGENDQTRDDLTLADLEAQDPFAFTTHWRQESVPGRSVGLATEER